MSTVAIRLFLPSSPTETFQCQSVIRSVWIDHGLSSEVVDRFMNAAHDLTGIEQNYLLPPRSHFWVAEDSSTGSLVGTVGLQPLSLGDRNLYEELTAESSKHFFPNISPDEICELKRLGVLSSYQKKKIGYGLVQSFFDFARKNGYKAVHLTSALDWKQASQFYTRMGFERGKVVCFSKSGDIKEREGESPTLERQTKNFERIEDLMEEDWREINRPVMESKIVYVQHYWMKL